MAIGALTKAARTVGEKTAHVFTTTLKDENDDPVALADIVTATLTYYDRKTGNTINSRSAQDVKNANDVTIHATSGLLTWNITSLDTVLVGSPAINRTEPHIALFRFNLGTDTDATEEVLIEVQNTNKV